MMSAAKNFLRQIFSLISHRNEMKETYDLLSAFKEFSLPLLGKIIRSITFFMSFENDEADDYDDTGFFI